MAKVITADQIRHLTVRVGADPDNTVLYTALMKIEVDIRAGSYSVMKSKVRRHSIGGPSSNLHVPADIPALVTMNSDTSTTPQMSITLQQRGADNTDLFGPVFFSTWRSGAELVRLETIRTGDPLEGVAMLINLVTGLGMDIYPRLSSLPSLPDNKDLDEAARIHEMLAAGVPVEWVK